MARARVNSYGAAAAGRSGDLTSPTRWGAVAGVVACALLLAAFAAASWSAVLTKSAAAGEPTHAVAGWMHLSRGDFRVNPDEPPLWKVVAARANAAMELPVEAYPKMWSRVLQDAGESPAWSRAVLYGTEGSAAAADAMLARSRAVMLAIAVGLGVMIGWWAWKIAGPVAAVVAVALFTLDPNFLAHAPLLEGDVAMSLALLASVYAAWRAGRRASIFRVVILALLAAAVLSLKFSGVFVLPIVCSVVIARVFVPASWPLFTNWFRKWWGRYFVAAVVVLVVLASGITGVWGTYAFRFHPAPDPASSMNLPGLVDEVAMTEARLKSRGRKVTTVPVEAHSYVLQAATYADAKRLMPQAWIYGFLQTYEGMLTRPAFLLDQSRRGGWWWYFPFAMAVKAPLGTIAALALAVWALLAAWKRYGTPQEAGAWTITCLALPVVLYLFFAMIARLDFGLRHVLPVYPFLFIAIGVAAALAWQRWRGAKWVMALIAIGIGTETVRAYPSFLPFFNASATALRHGVHLLGESNVDLGQDLPLLAAWQSKNRDRKLYLSYFGPADPALYGIKAVDVRKDGLDRKTRWRADPTGVLAVSATHLQGFAIEPESRSLYSQLRNREPREILGGSIYLYDLVPPPSAAAPAD